MFDECAQLEQDLTFAWVVEKNPWRCDGEARQQRLQSAVSNRGFRERARYLCKSQTLDRRSEERG